MVSLKHGNALHGQSYWASLASLIERRLEQVEKKISCHASNTSNTYSMSNDSSDICTPVSGSANLFALPSDPHMFVADVEVARSSLQARVQRRIVEQIIDRRMQPLQDHLSKRRDVRNVDAVTPQLVIMVVYVPVPQVPLPEVTEESIDISKLLLQLYTWGCSAALNFSGPQIDGATMERNCLY